MRRILVIKNRAIGDTILLTGALRLLRKHYPNHDIHVLVRSPAGELLEGLPYVDRIISVFEPKDKFGRLAYWLTLLKRLRAERYMLALNFHASFRSSLTAKLLRADTCVTNHHELNGRNWFSDLPVPGRGEVKSIIDRDLDLLRAVGITATAAEAHPEVVLSPYEHRQAAALFANKPAATGPRIFLGVGGSRETKRWLPGNFFALAQRMAKELDATFVVSTVAIDQAWMSRFLPLVKSDSLVWSRLIRFENQTLRETAKIISQCSIYVGNDSGLKHLAVALGLRTLTIFGPEMPLEWHPYDTKQHPYHFIEGLGCRMNAGKHWCSVPVCNRHGHRCMQQVTADTLWQDILSVTRETC